LYRFACHALTVTRECATANGVSCYSREEALASCGVNHEDFEMLRRITWLIPVLAVLTLSGCIIFPHGGWHGDHHRYYQEGPGYYHR
jgi:hypothetical protein